MIQYPSLEQRIAATYLDTLPMVVPSVDPGKSPQLEAYAFIQGVFKLIFENPSLLFPVLHADDAFNNRFNKSSDKKPELMKQMQKASKEMEAFLKFLFLFGAAESNQEPSFLRATKKYARMLSALGLEGAGEAPFSNHAQNSAGIGSALGWLAQEAVWRPLMNYRCIFSTEVFSLSGNYRKWSGNEEQYDRLVGHLTQHHYHHFKTPDSLSFELIKGKNHSLPQKGGFEYKVNHIGVSMNYSPLVKEPAAYSLCIPSMARLLGFFDEMDEGLQRFIVTLTKKCDSCRYCVQTDKTGTRPLAHITVIYQGSPIALCPYFPGYTYTFTHLNELIVDHMLKLLGFMEARLDQLIS